MDMSVDMPVKASAQRGSYRTRVRFIYNPTLFNWTAI